MTKVVEDARPQAVVHEATALSNLKFGRSLDTVFSATIALRTKGTDNLTAAAGERGVERIAAKSFATGRYERTGGMVRDEDAPLDHDPPKGAKLSAAGMECLDNAIVKAGGLALRYGGFYGAANAGFLEIVKKCKMPIVGSGHGLVSFIHLEDAAAATVLALERGAPGVYHVVDDESAPQTEWLPARPRNEADDMPDGRNQAGTQRPITSRPSSHVFR